MKAHVTFPLFDEALELLRAAGVDLDVFPGPVPKEPPEALLERAANADGMICTLFDRLDRPFFEALRARGSRLRAVAQFGVGYDNIDVAAATDHGVIVTNTPGALTDATAEMAVALALAAARRVGEGERLVRAGAWPGWAPNQMLGQGLTGKTLGVVGAGRIGTATALKLRGFDMPTLYTSRSVNETLERELGARRVELPELLAKADVITIHTALNAETRHLIGRDQLRMMKPTAVLVNTARGAVIDEAALVEALREGRIAAAGLDVYENEPALAPGLAELPNVVLAPHLGSATRQTRVAMGVLAATNLLATLKGEEPPNRVGG